MMVIFKKGYCQIQALKILDHFETIMNYWYFFCILSLFYPLNIQQHQTQTHILKMEPTPGITRSCDAEHQAPWKSYVLLAESQF